MTGERAARLTPVSSDGADDTCDEDRHRCKLVPNEYEAGEILLKVVDIHSKRSNKTRKSEIHTLEQLHKVATPETQAIMMLPDLSRILDSRERPD